MKYLFYFVWVVVFYLLLKIIGQLTGSVTPAINLIVAFLLPLLLKRFLPLLKDKNFSEIVSFLKLINKKNSATLLPQKKCSVCNMRLNSKIIMKYGKGSNLGVHRQKTFCPTHGLLEWGKLLEIYQIIIIFAEPGISQAGGSSFYEPEQLKSHGYSNIDEAALKELIAHFPHEHTYEKILWLPNDVIGVAREKPLFKKESAGEYITVDELVKRMRKFLQNLESKFNKYEYLLSEPHGKAGIYIWNKEG